jgi:hypothetical protein
MSEAVSEWLRLRVQLAALRFIPLRSQTAMKRAAQPRRSHPAFGFMAAPSCSSYIRREILPIIGGYSGRLNVTAYRVTRDDSAVPGVGTCFLVSALFSAATQDRAKPWQLVKLSAAIEFVMNKTQEPCQLSVVRHLLCPTCLKPMHIRLAEVSPGREKIQFTCDSCGTQTEREY